MRRLALLLVFLLSFAGLGAPLAAPTVTLAQNVEPLRATVYDNQIQWRADPGTAVAAVVRDAQGVKARGQGRANAGGTVNINLQAVGGGPGGGGAGRQYLRPSDTISLTVQGGTPVLATVPALAADIDPVTDRVVGRAPAGADVEVVVHHGPDASDVLTETVKADGAGAFQLDLAGRVDVMPGTDGAATTTVTAGHQFRAAFAVLESDLTVGSRAISGRASLGAQLTVTILAPDGTTRGTLQQEVLGDIEWSTPGGGGGPGGGAALPLVAVGDRVRVAKSGGPVGADQTLEIVVPQLQVDVNKDTGVVTGVGPANAGIVVLADGPGNNNIERRTTTDASGFFRVELGQPIDSGWRVFVTYDPGTGIRVRSLFTVPQIEIPIHGTSVGGVSAASVPITVTLRTKDGDLKGRVNTNTNNNGNFNANFSQQPNETRVEPGDVVEVDLTSGDPLLLPVPLITAQTNADADTVSGVGPADATLQITAPGQGGPGGGTPAVTLDVKVGADGTYVADFAGQRDIVAPMNGTISYTESRGHVFTTGWAAVRLNLTLGENTVTGNGAVNRKVTVTLKTPDNKTAALVETRVSGGGGGGPAAGGNDWVAQMIDVTSQQVEFRTGDTLQVTVGDDQISLLLPTLSGVAFIGEDLVNGITEPDTEVRIQLTGQGGGGPGGGGGGAVATVTSDAQGLFDNDFSEARDMLYNDIVQLRILQGPHQVYRIVRTPGLRLNFNNAVVTGAIEPSVDYTAQLLTSTGGVRKALNGRTAEDATFAVQFLDASSEPMVPNPGDKIVLAAPSAQEAKEVSMEVPELTVQSDAETEIVNGRATPGGNLTVQVSQTFFRPGRGGGGFGVSRPQIAEDGTWQARFGGGGGGGGQFNVVPGQQFEATYRLPVGHIAVRTHNEPLVNAQIGGGRVCGVGPERTQVTADVTGASGPTGSGRARSDNFGSFEVRLIQGGVGTVELATAPGQTVGADIAGKRYEEVLPELIVAVDWDTGRVTGTAPPNTQVFLTSPALGCLGTRDFEGGGIQFGIANSGANGQFGGQVALRDPGEGFEVAVFNADGHRAYRHVYRTLGQIYVRKDQVGGQATPLSPVTAVLKTSGGQERGRYVTVADSSGRFLGRVEDASDQPVIINAGDVVSLEAGGELVDIKVEDLTFDFDPVNGLSGAAPANRDLTLYMQLADRRLLTVELRTDNTGRYGFRAADIPPRADWTFADVRRVRVVLPTAAMHQIIAEEVLGGVDPGPTPTPGRPTNRLYLPFSQKARS